MGDNKKKTFRVSNKNVTYSPLLSEIHKPTDEVIVRVSGEG